MSDPLHTENSNDSNGSSNLFPAHRAGSRARGLLLASLLLLACGIASAAETLIPMGAIWRYLDTGIDQGAAWRQTNFNDGAWAFGPSQLGLGDGDEATVVNGGPSGARYSIYFRHTFAVQNRATLTNVALRVLRDDGAVVYLNGVEVFRSNMPDAPITYGSWSSVSVSGSEENTFFAVAIPPALLLSGTNVVAAEIHQSDPGSSDLSFNLELLANTPLGNLPPVATVSITPMSQIVGSNEIFQVDLAASDPETAVTQIDLLRNGVLAGTIMGSSGKFNLLNSVVGIHEFSARPRDTAGIMSVSPPARILVTRAGFQAQSIFFPQFASAAGLTLQNGASISSNVLHLNQAVAGSRGGVWLPAPQNVLSGFVSDFRFRIISKVGGGADGFCFNIAGAATQPNIGSSIGYSGITNCLSVEFDTYMNTSATDPDDHHISVHSRGLIGNTSDESASLGLYTPPTDFSDGGVHSVRIEYVPGTLRVYLDNFITPALTVAVDLSTLLSLPGGNAWIGLAAGTGSSYEYHDILTWSFTTYANVPPTVSLVSPAQAIRVAPGMGLTLSATANDPNGDVTSVSFFDGTQTIGHVTNAPYTLIWSNLPVGIHVVRAVAADDGGLYAESAPVVVEVVPTNATVTLYSDFNAPTNLLLQGSAVFAANQLRLTAAVSSQIGSAWLDSKQSVQHGFETVFTFRITQPSSQGGDGLAFVIQNNPSPMTGGGGVSMGYSSIPNSLAIEFDTYLNTPAADLDANHIGVHSQGTLPNSANESAALDRVSPPVDLSDGKVHAVLIRYFPGRLRVFVDDLTVPVLQLAIDLGTLLNLDKGTGWVGFTSSTGSEFENHDVLMWSFRPNIRPSIQLTPLPGIFLFPTNLVLSASLFDSDGEAVTGEFFVNGTSLGPPGPAPLTKLWSSPSAGNFQITARATDDFGAITVSDPIVLSVFELPNVSNQTRENNGGIAFDVPTTTGQTYTIQYSADLLNWSNAVPTMKGIGAILRWHDAGPPVTYAAPENQPRRFYRILVTP